MPENASSLWRNRDFMNFWAGQTVSQIGSQVTLLALPLTAVLTLQATPAQMGILQAAQYAPFLLVGLFAGVMVDRLPRRAILLSTDIGRALILCLVPAAAMFHLLRMEHLYFVGFLSGVMTVFFDVAYTSLLPELVETDKLVDSNSKLQTSSSLAEVFGPSIAGVLVQLLMAPIAIVVDALSFLFSAVFISRINISEHVHADRTERKGLWREIGEGLRVVYAHPLLRAIAGCSASINMFVHVHLAVRILYITRDLSIEPAMLGVIVAFGSVGGLLGALLAKYVAHRAGVGPTIIGSSILVGCGALIFTFEGSSMLLNILACTVGIILWTFAVVIYNVNQASLRQTITPKRLLGRMNATIRFLTWGIGPIGAVLGGILGEMFGPHRTLVISALGMLVSTLWVILSPMKSLNKHTDAAKMAADESVAEAPSQI